MSPVPMVRVGWLVCDPHVRGGWIYTSDPAILKRWREWEREVGTTFTIETLYARRKGFEEMSTAKKLSEKLNHFALNLTEDASAYSLELADRARALEERVAELEQDLAWREDIAGDEARIAYELERSYAAATARAEAAEAEVAALKAQAARMEKYDVIGSDERDALRAKLEKVRAKAHKMLQWPVSSNPTAHKVAMAFWRILDGEGDT